MHDKLFANQQTLKRPDLEKYAAGDRPRRRQVQGRARQRRRQGAHRGRPGARPSRSARTGRRTSTSTAATSSGAQPFEEFKKVIDDELAARRQADRQGDAARPGLRRVHEGREGLAGRRRAAAAAAAEGPGRRHRGLQGRRRRRADQGRQAAEGHHHRVLRLPVPVLQPRQRHARAADQGLRQRRQHLVPAQPAAVPQQRHAGGAGGRGGARAGEVLGDARQAVRQPAEPRPPEPREVRPGDRPRHGQVQGRARQGEGQGAHQARHGRRRQVRRARHAQLLHQRAQLPRRAAGRGVQGASSTRRSRRRTRRSPPGTPRGKLYAALTAERPRQGRARRRPRPDSPTTRPASAPTSRARRSRAPRTRW